MELLVKVKYLPKHTKKNGEPRLVFCGGMWDAWDIRFCVHGRRLDLDCLECTKAIHKWAEENLPHNPLGNSPSQD